MKYVVYTSLTGGYDNLNQPLAVDPEFDYICFSNDIPAGRTGMWDVRPIPFSHKDKLVESRYAKLLPHVVIPEYECSVWIDANIVITGEQFYQYVRRHIRDEHSLIAQVNHIHEGRDCIYDEIESCVRYGKLGLIDALTQYSHLRRDHYPRHNGLYENNLVFRRHNDPFVKDISEQWWSEFMRYARRDQLSLNYIYWKKGYVPGLLLPENECARNVDYLQYILHLSQPDPSSFREWMHRKLIRPAATGFYRFVTQLSPVSEK